MTTSTKRSIRTRLTAAVAMLGASLMFAACGTSAAAPAAFDEVTAAPAADTYELRVTDPGNNGWLAVARRDGVIEAALEPLNATVNWVPAKGAVSANLPLFATGEIQVSAGAFTPVDGLGSNDAPIRIGAVLNSGNRQDAGIIAGSATTIQDLVGKKVTVNKAGKGEYIVLRALEQAGLPLDAIELVYLQPSEGLAAFKAGQVDGIATFGEFFRQAQEGANVVATEEAIDSQDEEIILFTTDLLDERPDIAKAVVEAVSPVIEGQAQTPEDYANVFEQAGPRALTGEALEWQINIYRNSPAKVSFATDEARAKLQSIIDLFKQGGVVPEGATADVLIADLNN